MWPTLVSSLITMAQRFHGEASSSLCPAHPSLCQSVGCCMWSGRRLAMWWSVAACNARSMQRTMRPRHRLPCTLVCPYQVTSAQIAPICPAPLATTTAHCPGAGRLTFVHVFCPLPPTRRHNCGMPCPHGRQRARCKECGARPGGEKLPRLCLTSVWFYAPA